MAGEYVFTMEGVGSVAVRVATTKEDVNDRRDALLDPDVQALITERSATLSVAK